MFCIQSAEGIAGLLILMVLIERLIQFELAQPLPFYSCSVSALIDCLLVLSLSTLLLNINTPHFPRLSHILNPALQDEQLHQSD